MKSKDSSIQNIKQFFSSTPDDVISLQDAYVAWGRDVTKENENKSWLSNKLTALKYHNLVKPIYTLRNGKRMLDKIQLTMEGKKALGRIGDDTSNDISSQKTNNHPKVSLEEIMKVVPQLRKENPEFEITFDVRLKSG